MLAHDQAVSPRRKQKSDDGEVQVVTEKRVRLQKPQLWRVLLHNDDFTTMEFVILVLVTVFSKDPGEANQLMLEVHQRGVCLAGVYTHEVAETKVLTVEQMAQAAQFPFLCTMEPVDQA